jgi:hypothetical protein
MQGIEPDTVDELGRSLDIPDGKIAPLALLKRADLSQSAERTRRFTGNAGHGLIDREPEQRRGHVHDDEQ